MIKIENKSPEEIAKIGREIGKAFAAEKDGIVKLLTEEQTIKAFEIMTECFYRMGILYSTSEIGEGYLAYWEKKTKPKSISEYLHMIERFLCELPPKAVMSVAKSGGAQYAKIFKKEKNFIAVEMVVVLREFQGKGIMHKVLELPFTEARVKNIPCVLDTDTPLKAKKYIKCGMKMCGKKRLKGGCSLYTMVYRE